jgi:hypothetical protein
MKKGFQIEIQSDLTEDEKYIAIKFADKFLIKWLESGKTWYSKAGYKPMYRRRVRGLDLCSYNVWAGEIHNKKYDYLINKYNNYGLVFRRASKNRRIFQIVKSELIVPRNSEENICIHGGCMCRHHGGKYKMATKYGDIKTNIYLTIGDIKGQ